MTDKRLNTIQRELLRLQSKLYDYKVKILEIEIKKDRITE